MEIRLRWGWIETRTKRDYSEIMTYGRPPSYSRELTTDEQAELDEVIVKSATKPMQS